MLPVDSWYRFSPNKTWMSKSPIEGDEQEDRFIPLQDESLTNPNHNDEYDLQPHKETKLSLAGKQMGKIVKHLDKSNRYTWEEEEDPYAVHFFCQFLE
jgi:hypothetical protein